MRVPQIRTWFDGYRITANNRYLVVTSLPEAITTFNYSSNSLFLKEKRLLLWNISSVPGIVERVEVLIGS